MKRVILWSLACGIALSSAAQSPDTEFLQIYNLIQEGESLREGGQAGAAMDRFRRAQQDLRSFAKAHPTWNEKIIRYRLGFLSDRLGSLQEQVPSSARAILPATSIVNAGPMPVPTPPAASAAPAPSGPAVTPALAATPPSQPLPAAVPVPTASATDSASMSRELAAAQARADSAEARASAAEARIDFAMRSAGDAAVLVSEANERSARLALELRQARDRVEVLEASHANLEKSRDRLDRERSTLESKLREALSPKAAAVDPVELAKAEDRILILIRENEILKAALDHQMVDNRQLVEKAKRAIEFERQLEVAQSELTSVRREAEELRDDKQKLQARLDTMNRKSDEQVASLEGEIETLRRDLAGSKAASRGNSDAVRQLASVKDELSEQRMATEKLRRENDSLIREIDKLTNIRVTPASLRVSEVPEPTAYAAVDAARFRRLERERDDLRRELEEVRAETRRRDRDRGAGATAGRARELAREVARLEARVTALEAKPDPYTPEELALFHAPPVTPEPSPLQMAQATPPAAPPTTPAGSTGATTPAASPSSSDAASATGSTTTTNRAGAIRRRTTRDLPPGAGELSEQARRAFATRRLGDAERAYRDILKLDENNVFTLGNLAAIVIEQGRAEEGETLLKRALAQDAQDPFSLSLLGIMRFRQQRYDDAFAALSEAARLDPEDAATQTYLGITLSERGQRSAAEAALRKALKLNPGSPAAHYNLAVVYATQKPPFLELARFHYEKARRAGQPSNPAFEAVLRGESASPTPPPAANP